MVNQLQKSNVLKISKNPKLLYNGIKKSSLYERLKFCSKVDMIF